MPLLSLLEDFYICEVDSIVNSKSSALILSVVLSHFLTILPYVGLKKSERKDKVSKLNIEGKFCKRVGLPTSGVVERTCWKTRGMRLQNSTVHGHVISVGTRRIMDNLYCSIYHEMDFAVGNDHLPICGRMITS